MGVAGETPAAPASPATGRRRRSFQPRYPAWLLVPSFLYDAVFFLGAMALLVMFSLATQTGFSQITYRFDTSQ